MASPPVTVAGPHWPEIVESVLRSSALPSDALNCLDKDDRTNLCRRFAQAISFDSTSDLRQSDAVKAALVEWLQDWSESDERRLISLVELVREMRGVESLWTFDLDWAVEGF